MSSCFLMVTVGNRFPVDGVYADSVAGSGYYCEGRWTRRLREVSVASVTPRRFQAKLNLVADVVRETFPGQWLGRPLVA